MIRTYPDPDSIVYGTTLPPRYPCRLTTRTQCRVYPIHDHNARVDGWGNGNTDAVAGHWHAVRDGQVLPDPRDGHTHRLTLLPCGAG